MSKAWEGGSTRAWRKVRARVLSRDGYLCQLRIPRVCTVDAPLVGGHVHHLHGKDACLGCAADNPGHLTAACKACNLHVGDPSTSVDPPNRGVTKW